MCFFYVQNVISPFNETTLTKTQRNCWLCKVKISSFTGDVLLESWLVEVMACLMFRMTILTRNTTFFKCD